MKVSDATRLRVGAPRDGAFGALVRYRIQLRCVGLSGNVQIRVTMRHTVAVVVGRRVLAARVPYNLSLQGRLSFHMPNQSTSRGRSNRLAALLVAVASVVLVAGCSSAGSPNSQVSSSDMNVKFNACTEQLCAGTLDGKFPFKIEMPTKWNGTLLLYSHEYRPNVPLPGGKLAGADPVLSPEWTVGEAKVGKNLLDVGFALAGAAAPDLGWRVDEQIQAADALYGYFKDKVATPDRVYTWGPSTGAVASVNLAQNRDWVNGTAPLCGNLAGLTRNYDIALDAAFSVQQLFYPEMKLVNYLSLAEAKDTYKEAMKRVNAAAKDQYGTGAQKLAVLGLIAVVPSKTATLPGTGIAGQAKAIAANLGIVLARSTVDRYAVEQQLGGNPSSNVGTDYYARPTQAEIEKINKSKPGILVKYAKVISKGKRVPADESALNAANATPGVSGEQKVPFVSLHTEYDADAIVQNEGAVIAAANVVGNDSRRLIQANVISPPLFAKEGEVSVGAGHCTFTAASVAGTVVILDKWVRNGQFPTEASTTELLGSESGYNPAYLHRKWPNGPTQGQPSPSPTATQ